MGHIPRLGHLVHSFFPAGFSLARPILGEGSHPHLKLTCTLPDTRVKVRLVAIPTQPTELPNLERSAKLLGDLPVLWSHPGVTHEQREELVREVFHRITIDGKEFMSIEPKAPYAPLFASIVTSEEFGYWEPNSPPLFKRGAFRLDRDWGASFFVTRTGFSRLSGHGRVRLRSAVAGSNFLRKPVDPS